jgi:UDP-GlcNAc:undecaprenyl-phosphate GlcNAc-1-phosphate transferase
MPTVALKLIFSFIISFLITFYFVPLLSAIAHKLGVVDVPDGRIKVHEKTTPYLGGVAVYIGFISGLALVFPLENSIFSLLVGSTLLLFIGLIDDLVVLKPYQKFCGQILAAFCFIKGGLYLKEQFFHDHYLIALPISMLWILTITNAMNLVDVMDGLATTIALCASLSFGVLAWLLGYYDVMLLISAFVGPLLAFLWYNKPPASMYLGDAGSLFIGGFLSSVPFLLSWSSYNPYGFCAPAIILGIPLCEVIFLIIVRTYKGIPFYKGSPDHFSIYLRARGWSKYRVLGYVVVLSCILLVTVIFFIEDKISFTGVVSLSLLYLAAWLVVLLKK